MVASLSTTGLLMAGEGKWVRDEAYMRLMKALAIVWNSSVAACRLVGKLLARLQACSKTSLYVFPKINIETNGS